MSDIVNLKNGGAIDARFQAVDERFTSVNKDFGRLEKRVEDIESQQVNHHDGLNRHDWAIEGLTKALVKVSASIEEFSDIKHQIKGGIKLWKWFLAPIGGASGIFYIASKIWGF